LTQVAAAAVSILVADGTVIRGWVGADDAVADAADRQFDAFVDEAKRGASPDARRKFEAETEGEERPTMTAWLHAVRERWRESAERTWNHDESRAMTWGELADDELMAAASFDQRSGITLVGATVELPGKPARKVGVLRVQLAHVHAWWFGHDDG
jgi:hypothetical protein